MQLSSNCLGRHKPTQFLAANAFWSPKKVLRGTSASIEINPRVSNGPASNSDQNQTNDSAPVKNLNKSPGDSAKMDEPSWSADPAIQTMAFTAALVVSSTTFTLSTIMHGMTSGLSNYGPRQLRSALARLAHLLSLESFARAAQALAHRAANAVRVAGTPLIVGGGIAMGALVGLLMVVLAGPALTVPSAAVGLGVAALGGATVAGNLAVSRAARAAEAERARSAALADRAAALENALQESRRDALEIMTQAREASELRMQLSESHTERASLVKRAEADQKDFKRRIVGLEAELQITRQQKGAAEAQLQSLEAERARLVADVKRQKSKIFSLEARAAELEAEREHQGHLIQKEVIRAQAAQARAAQAESVAREALAETDSVRKRWQSALSALRRGIGFSQQKRRLEAQRDEVVAMMVQGQSEAAAASLRADRAESELAEVRAALVRESERKEALEREEQVLAAAMIEFKKSIGDMQLEI